MLTSAGHVTPFTRSGVPDLDGVAMISEAMHLSIPSKALQRSRRPIRNRHSEVQKSAPTPFSGGSGDSIFNSNEIERVGLRQFAHTHTTNGHFGHTSSENYQYWDLKAQPEPVLFQSHERALGLSR